MSGAITIWQYEYVPCASYLSKLELLLVKYRRMVYKLNTEYDMIVMNLVLEVEKRRCASLPYTWYSMKKGLLWNGEA